MPYASHKLHIFARLKSIYNLQVVYHRSDVDYTDIYKNFKSVKSDSVLKVPTEDVISQENKKNSLSYAK